VSDLPRRREVPPPLTVAASLVAVQAVVLLGFAMVEITSLVPDHRTLGVSMAIFFAIYGGLLAATSLALWRTQGWARGPGLMTQLIQLGLAWNFRDLPMVAIALAISALLAIAGIVHPDSTKALEGIEDRGDDGGPQGD
jgi:hypothetical protein